MRARVSKNRGGGAVSQLQLSSSADAHYFIDGGGQPFLINGVAAWTMFAQLTVADAKTYMDSMASKNVNALIVSLVEAHYSNQPQFSGQSVEGYSPWTGTVFQSSLSSNYWNKVETLLDYGKSKGMVFLCFPNYQGNGGGAGLSSDEGWWNGGYKSAGSTNTQTYGSNVGSILKNHPNTFYCTGGDYWVGFDTSPSAAANLAIQNATITGIQSQDPNKMWAGHWNPGSATVDFGNSSSEFPQFQNTGCNYQYDIFSSYHTEDQAESGYNFTLSGGAHVPSFLGEEIYKNNGPTDLQMRWQIWRALCFGSCGAFVGDEYVWAFDTSFYNPGHHWYDNLNTPTLQAQALIPSIMGSRPWHLTAPDSSNVYVTSGKGSRSTDGYCPVRASSSLLLGYCPSGATLTIDQSKFSANIDIKKIDPANGAVTTIASNVSNSGSAARAFTGTNSAGDSDWIAVVELH